MPLASVLRCAAHLGERGLLRDRQLDHAAAASRHERHALRRQLEGGRATQHREEPKKVRHFPRAISAPLGTLFSPNSVHYIVSPKHAENTRESRERYLHGGTGEGKSSNPVRL